MPYEHVAINEDYISSLIALKEVSGGFPETGNLAAHREKGELNYGKSYLNEEVIKCFVVLDFL